jgi:predicted nucleotidyltransferase
MMQTEIAVMNLLLKNPEPKTIREISKGIKSDYRITYIAIQRLIDKGSLIPTKVGKSTLCRIDTRRYTPEIEIAELERRGEFLKNKNMLQLRNEIIMKAPTSLFVCLLFGSRAKGTATSNSDTDILFITNNPGFERSMQETLSTLPLRTHAIVLTEEEFIRMKNSNKPNVVHEAILAPVILYGTEAYYLMKNA